MCRSRISADFKSPSEATEINDINSISTESSTFAFLTSPMFSPLESITITRRFISQRTVPILRSPIIPIARENSLETLQIPNHLMHRREMRHEGGDKVSVQTILKLFVVLVFIEAITFSIFFFNSMDTKSEVDHFIPSLLSKKITVRVESGGIFTHLLSVIVTLSIIGFAAFYCAKLLRLNHIESLLFV